MRSRVAVIIPCFNDGTLALEAVASISESEPVEIIVVDDGSTQPETEDALAQMPPGVRVIKRNNGGLAAARMSGVENSVAPYVYPLDSDDLLVEGSLASMADALDSCPDAGFAYGAYEFFGDHGGVWEPPEQFSVWAQTYANFIPVGSMVRREALLDCGGWQLRHGVEDWDLWLAMAERGWGGAHCERVVYKRRLHGSRMHAEARGRHKALVALLRERHPALFDSRKKLADDEGVPLRKRVIYAALFGARNNGWFPYVLERNLMRVRASLSAR